MPGIAEACRAFSQGKCFKWLSKRRHCCVQILPKTKAVTVVTSKKNTGVSPAASRAGLELTTEFLKDHRGQNKLLCSEKYMTQLARRRSVPAMPRNTGHSPLSQPEETNPGQGQQEEIQALAMQLIQIGDSVHRRMTQEDPENALPPLVEGMVFMRGRVLLRFFWNNHWL